MCQKLHREVSAEPRAIPSFGIGYKIFKQHPQVETEYHPMLKGNYQGGDPIKDWIKWLQPYYSNEHSEEGFCFFRTEHEAKQALSNWIKYTGGLAHLRSKDYCIKRIRYRGGLGEITERLFLRHHPMRMCLCKEFIIDDMEAVVRQ